MNKGKRSDVGEWVVCQLVQQCKSAEAVVMLGGVGCCVLLGDKHLGVFVFSVM